MKQTLTPAARWTVLTLILGLSLTLITNAVDHWFPRLVVLVVLLVTVALFVLDLVEEDTIVAEIEDVHPAQENGHYRTPQGTAFYTGPLGTRVDRDL